MNNTDKRTPLNWVAVAHNPIIPEKDCEIHIQVYGQSDKRNGTGTLTIATVQADRIWNYSNEEAEANAEMIVKAVNNYPKLVEALEDLLGQCQFIPKSVFTNRGKEDFQNCLNKVSALISELK